MVLPEDNFILLSLINTKLRDDYSSLDELCCVENVDRGEVCSRLASLGFSYDERINSFK